VWSGGTMIIVESPLDVVKLSSLGIAGGVSTFGASISQDQVDLMRRADKLIIAFDNPRLDQAGKKASKDMLERTKKEGLECLFFNYQDNEAKDIGDLTEEQVILGIEKAKHSVFGEAAFL
jgi:DNA primase